MTNTPIVAGLDLETTGFLAADHRIIEVYIGLWKGPTKVFEFDHRIDPQRAIAADAQRVHNISSTDLIGKPTWETLAPAVHKVLDKADYYVWHNGDEFDGPFLAQEFARVGLSLPDKLQSIRWQTAYGQRLMVKSRASGSLPLPVMSIMTLP